jgi:hypothetical protein
MVVVAALAIAGWALFAFVTVVALIGGQGVDPGHVFQVDWNVYATGARDLLDRDLYRAPLDANGAVLSTSLFNLPPLSALWAVPLLALPPTVAGFVWQLVGAASIAATAVIALSIWRLSRPILLAGLVLGPLSITLFYLEGLHLGTNNYFMLLLDALGCLFYMHRRDSWAGVFIGLAIGTKLWPVTLLVVGIRERRWRTVGVASALVAVQAIAFLAWLGPDIIGPAVAGLSFDISPTGYLIGPSAFDATRELWNGGLGALVAVLLVALPLRGRAGLGAAVIAGMAPIANLWIHYGPTVLFGLSCVAAGLRRPSTRVD